MSTSSGGISAGPPRLLAEGPVPMANETDAFKRLMQAARDLADCGCDIVMLVDSGSGTGGSGYAQISRGGAGREWLLNATNRNTVTAAVKKRLFEKV